MWFLLLCFGFERNRREASFSFGFLQVPQPRLTDTEFNVSFFLELLDIFGCSVFSVVLCCVCSYSEKQRGVKRKRNGTKIFVARCVDLGRGFCGMMMRGWRSQFILHVS